MKLIRFKKYALVAIVLLLAACGQKYEARKVVDAFIADHALVPDEMKVVSVDRFDSTKVLSDSVFTRLQQRGHEWYEPHISYVANRPGRMLYLLRLTIKRGDDTLSQTFYLDEQIEHVVAFK